MSGAVSSTVRFATVDERYGSFSSRHIRPSASDIRGLIATSASLMGRRLRPSRARRSGSARDRGVLELVEAWPAGHQVEDPIDGLRRELDVATGPVHQADEHRLRLALEVIGDEGGHAPDAVLVDRDPRAPCGSCRAGRRPRSLRTPRRRRRRSPAARRRSPLAHGCGDPRRGGPRTAATWVSKNRSGCWSRTTTPACNASRPVSFAGSSQTSVSPSATCACPSEKGTNRTSQSAPACRRGHHVLVSSAGERAAVVERDGEGAGGHASANPRRGQEDSG